MSDEEDTTILLSGRKEGREKSVTVTPPPVIIKSNNNAVTDKSQSHAILASSVAMLGGLAFGYDIGSNDSILHEMELSFRLTCLQQHMTFNMWLVGAAMASVFGGVPVDRLGRRWSTVCANIMLSVGSAVSILSSSYAMLLCGRLVAGFGGALSAVALDVYLAELATPVSRGKLVQAFHLGAAAGIVLAGSVAGGGVHWLAAASLGILPPLVAAALAVRLPPSPHFTILRHVAGDPSTRGSSSSVAAAGSLLETLALALVLVSVVQFSGHSSVALYTRRLFALLGVCSESAGVVTNITIGIVKVCFTGMSVCLVDRIGRRPALLVATTCAMLSVALLGAFSAYGGSSTSWTNPCNAVPSISSQPQLIQYSVGEAVAPDLPTGSPPPFPMLPTPVPLIAEPAPRCMQHEAQPPAAAHVLAILSALCYQAAYAFGLGPVTWLLLAELFPATTKGRALALTAGVYWLDDFIVRSTFSSMVESLSVAGTFLLNSVVCMMGVLLIFLFVPETKGKSLHQIAQELKNVSPKTRMYQNLHGLPCLSNNEWLLHKSRQYRQVSHSGMESTVI
ncbi:solute carrier family 2, facilitated glucose transporter member 10-like [Schistocerca cancellata]|uniref:solute carrier family 2, facilitated glucose transporter member 10-like n=1 Tax=Schistocerca cancellata TaxID=274614 RepID=UPI0021184D93|nr:solute carrier family 2, facilitated glucose transporter member 10-like [Schistocerca cancellata]